MTYTEMDRWVDEFNIGFSLGGLYEAALSRLKVSCRFNPAAEMHLRMLDDAIAAHTDFARGAELAAAAAFFVTAAPRGRLLEIGCAEFSCAAFELLRADNMTKIIAYAVSLRTEATQGRDIGRQFYENMWENAYIGAASDALRETLAVRVDGLLSDSFGPGYYGMALEEMKKLARVLDFGKIGAEILENGLINPPKSCAGIIFAVRDLSLMPAASCRDCLGDRAGCAVCDRSRQRGAGE
jgi:hypothetical protein